MKIYKESFINVMVLSERYASKPKDSVVALEKKTLFGRHVTKGDEKSLFILNINNAPIPDNFEDVTFHAISNCGITGAVDMIVERLIEKWHSASARTNKQPPCHPQGIETHRGALQPCEFEIISRFKDDELHRWGKLGDVLVDIEVGMTLRNGLHAVYLIPSGRGPAYLGHSTLLKLRPELLRLKKALAKEFSKKYHRQKLRGDLFYIEKDGQELPHVYCSEFDSFLIENHAHFPLK